MTVSREKQYTSGSYNAFHSDHIVEKCCKYPIIFEKLDWAKVE